MSLRIAMFAGTFPAVSETFILRQITGLIDLGHDVDIFADTRAVDAPAHPELQNYHLLSRTTFVDGPAESIVWEMPVWPIWERTWIPGAEYSIHNTVRLARALPCMARAFARHPRLALSVLREAEYNYKARSLSALYRLAHLTTRRCRYDVLHAHFGPVGDNFRFARELWNAPLVVSFHGYDFSTLPRKEGWKMYDRLFAAADLITVNSDYTRSRVEHLGCPSKKLRKLPVGLDTQRFPFRERRLQKNDTVRVLTVARLVEIKGVEYVIRAIAQLRARYANLRYDVIGDGPLRPKLQALICEMGLESVVHLHGAKVGSDVLDLMDKAHLFVLASVSVDGDQEGQGLVLQEAQACGIPVVCTNHGALPEGLAAGESGFVVPERDPAALAERLHWLIEHEREWPAMGTAGRRFAAADYDILKLNKRLVEIYTEARAQFAEAK